MTKRSQYPKEAFYLPVGYWAAAAGAAMNKGLDSKALCSIVAEMTQGLTENELAGLQADRPLTAGERLYQAYGITGIRGEVEAGFPSVRQNGLPGLKEAFAKGAGLNDALVHALVHLMTVVQDSNVIWRGGYAKLPFVQQRARDILAQGSILLILDAGSWQKVKNFSGMNGSVPAAVPICCLLRLRYI